MPVRVQRTDIKKKKKIANKHVNKLHASTTAEQILDGAQDIKATRTLEDGLGRLGDSGSRIGTTSLWVRFRVRSCTFTTRVLFDVCTPYL